MNVFTFLRDMSFYYVHILYLTSQNGQLIAAAADIPSDAMIRDRAVTRVKGSEVQGIDNIVMRVPPNPL